MKYITVIAIVIAISFGSLSWSRELAAQSHSKYAGQENREIRTLSKSDIEDLRNGRGWGLAKAAELNGYPGPVHLLEMKKEIGLTGKQLSAIETLYSDMRSTAVPLGLKLIELEKELNILFAEKTVEAEILSNQLGKIAEVRKELRFVHLSAHLKTVRILTEMQVSKYNKLRGYDAGDPCENTPTGHDPELWKKHNNCG